MKPIHVFVSHSHEDVKMAKNLSNALGGLDVVPFLAHNDIVGGELWKEAIRDRLVECDVLVALLTDNFRKSRFTEQEVGAAWVLEKPVLPLYTGNEMPSGFIADRQYIKYDNDNPERAAGEILKFVLIEMHGKGRAMDRMVDMLAKSESERGCKALVPVLIYEKERTPKQTKRIKNAIDSNPHVKDAVGREVIHYMLHELKESSWPGQP